MARRRSTISIGILSLEYWICRMRDRRIPEQAGQMFLCRRIINARQTFAGNGAPALDHFDRNPFVRILDLSYARPANSGAGWSNVFMPPHHQRPPDLRREWRAGARPFRSESFR